MCLIKEGQILLEGSNEKITYDNIIYCQINWKKSVVTLFPPKNSPCKQKINKNSPCKQNINAWSKQIYTPELSQHLRNEKKLRLIFSRRTIWALLPTPRDVLFLSCQITTIISIFFSALFLSSSPCLSSFFLHSILLVYYFYLSSPCQITLVKVFL